MAKGQQRSNREVKKKKQDKKASAAETDFSAQMKRVDRSVPPRPVKAKKR